MAKKKKRTSRPNWRLAPRKKKIGKRLEATRREIARRAKFVRYRDSRGRFTTDAKAKVVEFVGSKQKVLHRAKVIPGEDRARGGEKFLGSMTLSRHNWKVSEAISHMRILRGLKKDLTGNLVISLSYIDKEGRHQRKTYSALALSQIENPKSLKNELIYAIVEQMRQLGIRVSGPPKTAEAEAVQIDLFRQEY